MSGTGWDTPVNSQLDTVIKLLEEIRDSLRKDYVSLSEKNKPKRVREGRE